MLADGVEGLMTLFDPRRVADPYPTYAWLRAARPVWRPAERVYVLSRHEDCVSVLRDPRFGRAEEGRLGLRRVGSGTEVTAERPAVRSFLALNPPDHTRLRRLVSKAFTPARVRDLGPRIDAIAAELIETASASGEPVDLIAALASPLPVTVISELLGVPSADYERLVGWSDALARGLDPGFLISAEDRERQQLARAEFGAYLSGLIAERRRSPGDDLVSALAGVVDDGDVLSEEELIATCILLLVAGHETTTSLMGAAVLGLLQHPDQLARLRAEPELMTGAVEEFLRYDPPVQLTARVALTDASIGSLSVSAGSAALMLVGAANRDPALCADPDDLDIARPPTHHVSFGQGIHFCLGAPLARLETQIVLRQLLERPDDLRLAGEPAWKENTVLRGLRGLPVTFGRR
ncbi:MAG TPA: cytochrome P450 [Streptosporangiaceae bacterium]